MFQVGHTHSERITISAELVERFADFSGDSNPLHVDRRAAQSYGYPRPIAHGAILILVLSRMIGTELPGPGAVWLKQTIDWKHPMYVGDVVDVKMVVTAYSAAVGIVQVEVKATNHKDEVVMEGKGEIKVAEKIAGVSLLSNEAGRVVVVTGGSRGIGATIVTHLAERGWSVVLNYLNSAAGATKLIDEITRRQGRAVEFQADVSKVDGAKGLVDHAIRTYGRIDAVVHCATPPLEHCDVVQLSYGTAEPYLKTYVGAAMEMIAAAVPDMKQRKFGRFVFLGTSALFGIPPQGWSAYVVAKAALQGLVWCAASELGRSGITVNMISPGMTITDLTAGVSMRAKEIESVRSPMRRLAQPEDTSHAVGFLLSNESGYMNGLNLPLTGGPI